MTLQVFTARMGYKADTDWLDITRGGNAKREELGGHRGMGKAFVPSEALLRHYLRLRSSAEADLSEYDWQRYVVSYTEEMRDSYVRQRASWVALLALPRVVAICFCSNHLQCHRTILAQQILPKLGATYAGEIS
jgi:hypothetical protein